jgi:hypothetical protein
VNLTLTINLGVSGPALTITGATVGKNLQTPVIITLSQGSTSMLPITISSNNPSAVTLAEHVGDVGTGSLTIPIAAGVTTFSVSAQGLASSGSATLTVAAAGYISGTSTVNLASSGFVLAGPNGVGGSFVINQNSNATLTVSAAQLDGSGNVAQIQQVKGGLALNVPLVVANSALGTVSPAPVSFSGGIDSLQTQFTAGSSAGSTTISLTEPSGFATPAGAANIVAVTVQPTGIIPSNATVGQNLETPAVVRIQGAASSNLTVTISSNDPSKLLLSTSPTAAGSASITRVINAGFSQTGTFYLYGLGNTGTVTYTASASGFGSANGTVTLGKSGFVVSGPFGLGQDFPTTTGSGSTFLDIQTALLDASGAFVTSQALAGGMTAQVNVTSSNTAVGTISTSPVTITGGTNDVTTQFQPLSKGSTLISVAGAAPYVIPTQYASLTATVANPKILISSDTVGANLEQQETLVLAAPAPSSGLTVTLSVASGPVKLSTTGTDAGSAAINVAIPAGSTVGSYFVYGQANSGTATINATAPGFDPATATISLAPSGIVLGGALGLGSGIIGTAGGPKQPFTISTAQLDPTTKAEVRTQPLAGNLNLTVALTSSDAAIGTVPATATIAGATDTSTVQFTPLSTGTTFISVPTPPAGFVTPSQFTLLQADVQ